MNKEEFLQTLRQALAGEVPQRIIDDNIRYYDGYIRDEVNKGSSEWSVLEELGDPRLIAKTIIDASLVSGSGNSSESFGDGIYSGGRDEADSHDSGSRRSFVHYADFSKWYWKLLGIVIVISFFFLVTAVIGGIFSLLITFAGPILVVFLIMWFFKSMRR